MVICCVLFLIELLSLDICSLIHVSALASPLLSICRLLVFHVLCQVFDSRIGDGPLSGLHVCRNTLVTRLS